MAEWPGAEGSRFDRTEEIVRAQVMSNATVIKLASLTFCLTALLVNAASAQFDSGSDGSDGAFNPTSDVTIDLSLADGGAGNGTYDPDRWVVVFNYTTIDVPVGVTVTFANHPTGAPVAWLASGNVTIEGTVDISGDSWDKPGPGGFAGGLDSPLTSLVGFGPGGSGHWSNVEAGGSYGTGGGGSGAGPGPVYGHQTILPLIGGSGGGAEYNQPTSAGGAGAGGLLVASSGSIDLNGAINAKGANGGGEDGLYGGGGAGGGIRLVANAITGSGSLDHSGGDSGVLRGNAGGLGRIRVEAPVITFPIIDTPPTITIEEDPGPVFPESTAPKIRIVAVDGQPFPADPLVGFDTIERHIAAAGPVTIDIEAQNVPIGTQARLWVNDNRNLPFSTLSTPLIGSLALSTATVEYNFPDMKPADIWLTADW